MSSRLEKVEEKRSRRQAVLFIFLTLFLILGVVFFGIPSLIKMAIFLSNLHSSGQAIETKDTVPPAPPRLQPLPEATNSAQLTLKGFAEAGATVKVTQNTKAIKEVIADKDGQFVVENVTLENDENNFLAKAIDTSGNESKPSPLVTVLYDNKAPGLKVTNPPDGAEFFDEDKEILVAGETEVEAKVTVNNFYSVVDTEGNFVKKITLAEGENEIVVNASDKAGNTSKVTLKVRYTP